MCNNTVATASDRNYLWGVLLLIASMRKNGMKEKVVVLGQDYLEKDCKILQQFDNVEIYKANSTKRSLACSKAEAMLHAKTENITWADCDGFFSGNVSKYLAPHSPEYIHIRRRSPQENALAFSNHSYEESGETIPTPVLDAWEKDVENAVGPSLLQCCSDCFLSVNKSQRGFLELWDKQMKKVLPQSNSGVVNNSSKWYHQVDESVLNSLLCFSPNAPKVTEVYKMDKDKEALYIHFVCHPKPWVNWTMYSFRHFDAYCDVVDYVLKLGLEIPNGKVPFSLNRKYKAINHMLIMPTVFLHKCSRIINKITKLGINNLFRFLEEK